MNSASGREMGPAIGTRPRLPTATIRPMARVPSLGPRGEGWVVLQAILFGLIFLAGVAGLVDPAWGGLPRLASTVGGLLVGAYGANQVRHATIDLADAGSLTPFPHPRPSAELIETGVYGRVRHPIYGGIILMAIGWSAACASLPATVASLALIPLFVLKSSVEERWLAGRFPAYEAYRRRTRRFIAWPG